MLGIPRSARLVLIVLAVVVLPSIYILYPHHDIPQAPGSRVEAYEAGGIDSEHWRDPVRPDFENEEARWSAEESVLDSSSPPYVESDKTWLNHGMVNQPVDNGSPDEKVIGGGVIMPKLGNATAKAELGRAAWHVLHLMTLRYPDEPSEDDRQALKSYFHLFSRLYPCGECAAEFQILLKKYTPQTSSRKSASLWLCHVHNVINERLGKPEFDCLTLDEKYDCGCGPEGSASVSAAAAVETKRADEVNGLAGAEDTVTLSHLDALASLSLEEENEESRE